MRYFYLIRASRFRDEIVPPLAACWRERSFKPIVMCVRDSSIIPATPFRSDLWRVLAGELLLSCASELPELETPIEIYARLLHQPLADNRGGFSLIQQAICGSRDVSFGRGFYHPERAGWNDTADVRRLATWLETVNQKSWNLADLQGPTDADRADELAFAVEWFPELVALYRRAAESDLVIVSETV